MMHGCCSSVGVADRGLASLAVARGLLVRGQHDMRPTHVDIGKSKGAR